MLTIVPGVQMVRGEPLGVLLLAPEASSGRVQVLATPLVLYLGPASARHRGLVVVLVHISGLASSLS